MKLSRVLAAAAVLMLAANVAGAQVYGLPVTPTPTGLGAFASADYGKPDQPSTHALALTGGAGFGPFGASATIARVSNPAPADPNTAYGATVAMKLFGGGLMPVSIGAQAGIGRVDLGTSTITNIPVGIVARANVPLFPLKPWAIGYYTFGTNVEEEFRVSVGANFNFLLGLGVHAAYDYGDSGNTWGVGAHFNFRLPVPMM